MKISKKTVNWEYTQFICILLMKFEDVPGSFKIEF